MRSEIKKENETMEKKHIINKIDISYRDIKDCDYQFEVMKYILKCLSDKQLEATQKYIDVILATENNRKVINGVNR
jgi:hypothetical protein